MKCTKVNRIIENLDGRVAVQEGYLLETSIDKRFIFASSTGFIDFSNTFSYEKYEPVISEIDRQKQLVSQAFTDKANTNFLSALGGSPKEIRILL